MRLDVGTRVGRAADPGPSAAPPSGRRALVLVVAIGLALRIAVAQLAGPRELHSDAADYRQIAENLLGGRGYSCDGRPTAYRMPGYPLFLAGVLALRHDLAAVRIAQAALEVAIALLLYLAARRLYGQRTAVAAALAWSLFPLSVVQPTFVLGETLFTALFVSSVALVLASSFDRLAPAIGLGLLWGAAALVRPHMVAAPVVLAAWLRYQGLPIRRIVGSVAVVTGVLGLCLTPWLVRNRAVMGGWVLTTSSGEGLWIGNNPEANGSFSMPSGSPPGTMANELAMSAEGRRRAVAFVAAHPVGALLIVPKKIAWLYSLPGGTAVSLHFGAIPEDRSYSRAYRDTPVWIHLLIGLPFAAVVFLTVCSIAARAPADRGAVLTLLFTLLWVAVHAVYFGAPRFLYPLLPLYVVAACRAPATGELRAQGVGRRALVAAGGLALVAVWATELVAIAGRS